MTAETHYTQRLKALMQSANIHSYRQLAATAQVSLWQVQQLRQGRANTMRVAAAVQISQALQISLSSLLNQFGTFTEILEIDRMAEKDTEKDAEIAKDAGVEATDLKKNQESLAKDIVNERLETALPSAKYKVEYERLQQSLAQQLASARSQFQSEALRTLETWLVQWPTIAKRAADRGKDLPAEKILPFVRPVEALVEQWGVEAIAPVDSQVSYNPQRHQLMGAIADAGAPVVVTHSGATHNGKLLHRAKVKKADGLKNDGEKS